MKITINGSSYEAEAEERLVDVINRVGKELPQVCYHPDPSSAYLHGQ
jgi:NADH dehydrogenase/NADH:ubiquinone oxidoreductase subunit G